MCTEQLLQDLLTIETKLEQLSSKYSQLYENYNGESFAEQQTLAADKLDNLILAATHEAASQIGFNRHAILQLTQYIDFRKKYHYFNAEELSLIIDKSDLSAPEKLILYGKTAGNIDLNSIKNEWNQLFNNKPLAFFLTNLNQI